jgi:hypothetical protein
LKIKVPKLIQTKASGAFRSLLFISFVHEITNSFGNKKIGREILTMVVAIHILHDFGSDLEIGSHLDLVVT